MENGILEKEIEGEGQKSRVLILFTISRHQQDQQNHDQISDIKVLRQQIFQKAGRTSADSWLCRGRGSG